MPIFIPPTVDDVPAYNPNERRNQSPWRHFAPSARGVNVYKLTSGAYTQDEPNDETTVAFTYHGAHQHTVSAAEAALLTAAGYGANIT